MWWECRGGGGHWEAMHRCRLRPTDGPTLEGAHARLVQLQLVQTSGALPSQVVQAGWRHRVLLGMQGQAGSWAVVHGVATLPHVHAVSCRRTHHSPLLFRPNPGSHSRLSAGRRQRPSFSAVQLPIGCQSAAAQQSGGGSRHG